MLLVSLDWLLVVLFDFLANLSSSAAASVGYSLWSNDNDFEPDSSPKTNNSYFIHVTKQIYQ